MLGPFTINAYMPSFAEMKSVLGVGDVEMQLTLSLYFVAFSFMSLWHGSLADSLGRRPVVITGLAVFALASVGVSVATSIEQIYVCRVLQGFSAGAGIVIGRAVIRDLYQDAAAQRMYALVLMLFALAPAIGPVVGGWLQVYAGWRSIFVFLGGMSTILLITVLFCLPETLPRAERHPLSAKALLHGYQSVLTNKPFVLWAVSYALLFAGYFIYVLSAPIFLMQHLELKETQFLYLFGPATAGLIVGSHLAGRFAHSWSAQRSMITGFLIMGLATLWNLAICSWNPDEYGWYLPYLFIYTLGTALVQPTITLLGLDCVPDRRGMGSSLQLFTQTGFNAILSAVIAPFFWASPLKLAVGSGLMMSVALGGVLLAWKVGRPQRALADA